MRKLFENRLNLQKKSYVTLDLGNRVDFDKYKEKRTIHELTVELECILKELSEFNLSYEELADRDILVLECGDIKVDLEGKKIKVENVNKELALVALANR